MKPFIEESSGVDTNTLGVFRTAATVKGGRRFSFGSMVVAGDRQGRVGLGYGKANEVPPAIEKAGKEAKKGLVRVHLQGSTIPHEVVGKAGATTVKLMPASPGTGVVAGSTTRAILEAVGITDCMTKAYGSTNKKNVAKAVMDGLRKLRSKEEVGQLRGVELGESEVDERIARASAFMASAGTKAEPKRDAADGDGDAPKKDAGAEKAEKTAEAPADADAKKPEDEKPGDAPKTEA